MVGLVAVVLIVGVVVIRAGGGGGGGGGSGGSSSSGIGVSFRRNRAVTAGLDAERGGHFLLGRGWCKARERGRRGTGGIGHIVGSGGVGSVICGVIVVDRGEDLFVSAVVIRIGLPRPFYAEWPFLRLDVQKISVRIKTIRRRQGNSL